jgi:hypothetical protein
MCEIFFYIALPFFRFFGIHSILTNGMSFFLCFNKKEFVPRSFSDWLFPMYLGCTTRIKEITAGRNNSTNSLGPTNKQEKL